MDLSRETHVTCAYMARTVSEKIMSSVHPQLVPSYAVVVKDKRLVLQRVKMGKLINCIKGFQDLSFDIDFADIKKFNKNSRIFGALFNLTYPRYEMTMKSGQCFHFVFPRMQKILVGKDRYKEGEKSAIIDQLMSLN